MHLSPRINYHVPPTRTPLNNLPFDHVLFPFLHQKVFYCRPSSEVIVARLAPPLLFVGNQTQMNLHMGASHCELPCVCSDVISNHSEPPYKYESTEALSCRMSILKLGRIKYDDLLHWCGSTCQHQRAVHLLLRECASYSFNLAVEIREFNHCIDSLASISG